MRDEYKDIFGFDFVRKKETIAGDQYQIYKDGKEIDREVFTNEKQLLDWAQEHRDV